MQQKPVIHFAYDYAFYTEQDTGLIAGLEDIRFGVIAYDFAELCDAICNLGNAARQCGRVAESLVEYEDGHSCEKYLEFIKTKTRKS